MPEKIRKLLNKLNIGTNQVKLGDYIAALEKRVAELEKKAATPPGGENS
ncbi:hypothetical protein K32_49210 [Kaistia sp. 32K]|nr:hypothetical protein [Kaistia sp. 32K]BCP56304.1 hypothetical protein K32_49210 [Kaistia sp. 32K]